MRTERQPDWRSKESYAYTRNLTRLGWAWEFLRRNPQFQAELNRCSLVRNGGPRDGLRRWGILQADDPSKDALEAKVFWDPGACAHVLPLVAGHGTVPVHTGRIIKRRMRHVLICDGGRRLQLSVRLCAPLGPETLLTDAVVTPAEGASRWRALNCFNDFLFSGYLSPRDFRGEPASGRLAHVAQALDGAFCGASHREIAMALHGRLRVSRDWNDPGEYLRDGVRRAIRRGRLLMNGGYRRFLR
jgi:hypothetical protein